MGILCSWLSKSVLGYMLKYRLHLGLPKALNLFKALPIFRYGLQHSMANRI